MLGAEVLAGCREARHEALPAAKLSSEDLLIWRP